MHAGTERPVESQPVPNDDACYIDEMPAFAQRAKEQTERFWSNSQTQSGVLRHPGVSPPLVAETYFGWRHRLELLLDGHISGEVAQKPKADSQVRDLSQLLLNDFQRVAHTV